MGEPTPVEISVTVPLPPASALQLIEPRVTELVITSDEEYQYWAERLKSNKGAQGRAEAAWRALKEPLLQAIDRLAAFFNPLLKPMRDEEDVIKAGMIAYDALIEQRRKDEQAAAFRAADKERERIGRAIERADAKGDTDRVNELQEKQMQTLAPIIPKAGPRVAGAAYRKVWTFRITDPKKVPCKYHKIDEAMIRRQVNATRAETDIPGVEVYQETQLAVRAKP